jgi:hypothetical protein
VGAYMDLRRRDELLMHAFCYLDAPLAAHRRMALPMHLNESWVRGLTPRGLAMQDAVATLGCICAQVHTHRTATTPFASLERQASEPFLPQGGGA